MYVMKNLNMDVEMWTLVDEAGFEGLYEVSSFGRVRKVKSGKLMKIYSNGNGYLKVDFMKDGKRAKLYVHRLVAKAFVYNPDKTVYTVVNHLDENPLNNRADNLEWTTIKDNLNYGTAKERKEITRAMDSTLKARREKLQREIDALTLKKMNYNSKVEEEILARKAEIEEINQKIEAKIEKETEKLAQETFPEIRLYSGKKQTDEKKKEQNREYYQSHREEILAKAKARK